MTSAAKARVQALSEQLSKPRADPGTFENIPRIPKIAGPATGQRTKGKVVIVTGANSPIGIGRAAVHLFAENGAKAIYICDLNDEHLETHKRELNFLYPDVKIIPRKFDAANEADVESVVNDALKQFGRLDIFFANAGVSVTQKRVLESTAEDFMNVMRINSLSVFLAIKHGARGMLETSSDKKYPAGSIVATASVAGLRSNAGATDYSASKSAVISIVQTSAFQLAGTGIRVNSICPGLIETGITSPMFVAARARGSERKIGQLNPLMRGGIADEVARMALFLGSDESSYCNGMVATVDGGLSAGHPYVPGKLA